MPDQWEQWVHDGRLLVKKGTAARMDLGDLALEVAPWGRQEQAEADMTGRAEARLQRLATDIGEGFEQVRKVRFVAHRWPIGTRVPNVAYSVLRELAGREDRVAKLAELIDRAREEGFDRLTVDMAREWTGRRTTRTSTGGAAQRAEAAIEALEDSAVRREIVRSERGQDAVQRTYGAHVEHERQRVQEGAGRDAVRGHVADLHTLRERLAPVARMFTELLRTVEEIVEHNVQVDVESFELMRGTHARIGDVLADWRLAQMWGDTVRDAARRDEQ